MLLFPNQDRLFFYSSLNFLTPYKTELTKKIISDLDEAINNGSLNVFGADVRWLVKLLKWDSEYFNCPTYRLEYAEWDPDLKNPIEALAAALNAFKTELSSRHAKYYLFAEIPSEDTTTLQALGLAHFKLIETRLTYFYDKLKDFTWPKRYSVRMATKSDTDDLREVASSSINKYDRYHVDPFYPLSVANQYLATFIEKSIEGFADVVLVPGDNRQPGAFATANFISPTESGINLNLARYVLSAVSEQRRGWYIKLLIELNYLLQEKGIKTICGTTQSANRTVIRTLEKLGYRYGRSSHLLAHHKG